jgi:transcriptional regulator with XRE-family HTH domain
MKLAHYMSSRGIRPTDLAREIGVSHSAVIRWRDEKRIPEPEMMRRLLDATKGLVQPNDFFDIPDLCA